MTFEQIAAGDQGVDHVAIWEGTPARQREPAGQKPQGRATRARVEGARKHPRDWDQGVGPRGAPTATVRLCLSLCDRVR